MKPLANKLKLQKGDFLIESLVGLLLMSIVGLGITHIAGRVSVVQSKTSENAVVFDQLRATLTSNTGAEREPSLCSATGVDLDSIPGADPFKAKATQGCGLVTASVGGVVIAGASFKPPVILTAEAPSTWREPLTFTVGGH